MFTVSDLIGFDDIIIIHGQSVLSGRQQYTDNSGHLRVCLVELQLDILIEYFKHLRT